MERRAVPLQEADLMLHCAADYFKYRNLVSCLVQKVLFESCIYT